MKRVLMLAAAAVAALALGAPGAFAATTSTVTVTGFTTIASGLNRGDTVDIVATLTTDDPNENGEGEPLVLRSSGGFSATLPSYSTPTAFSFTASADGESLTGFISGYDGDESASVTVTVNSTAKKRFTPEQKDLLNRVGADMNIVAAGGATATALCLLLPPPVDLCTIFFGTFSGVSWIEAAVLQRLALDPADPNFTEIFQPDVHGIPPLTTASGATQAEVDAYNALFTNMTEAIAYANAAYVSMNRAQGAADAGSDEWEAKQVEALNAYVAHLGSLLAAQPALIASFADALQAAGLTRTIYWYDVYNFEFDAAFGRGLPQGVLDALHAAGADADLIEQIRQVAFVQDVFAVAGDYPAKLANQSLGGALAGLGSALGGTSSDTSPPTTTAALAGPAGKSGWYTGSVQVTLSATDPDGAADVASTHYAVDGGAAQAYSAPFTVSGDGTHSVSYWSVDRAGNEEQHRSVAIKVDATAPVVTGTPTPASIWPPNGKTVAVAVAGSASDATSGLDTPSASFAVADEYGLVQPSGAVSIAADGTFAASVPLEASRLGTDLDGRRYEIRVSVADAAGNVGVGTIVVIVPHDQR